MGMERRYRFDLVCPQCGKESEMVAGLEEPAPRVNCGDCLMERVEMVELRIVRVTVEEGER
jgi:ribosomal protein S27AE